MGRVDVLNEFAKSAPPTGDNGAAFYQYMFEQNAALKDLFKGAEDIPVPEVGKSELFHVQGEKLLRVLYTKLAAAADDDELLNKRCFNLVTMHKKFNMYDSAIWDALPQIITDFFTKRAGLTLTEDQVNAFNHIFEILLKQAHIVLDQAAPTS